MANRYFTQFFYTLLKTPVLITGKIVLAADASVTSFDAKGVASVTKTGTGEYTITLSDSFSKVTSLNAHPVGSSEDLVPVFLSYDASTKAYVLETKVAGTVADISAACEIHFQINLSNSSVD